MIINLDSTVAANSVKEYCFDESGKFVTDNQEYELYRNEFVLTTKAELPITLDETESILLNLPAPGRRQTLYFFSRICRVLCFC